MSDTDAPATGDEDVVNPADAQMGIGGRPQSAPSVPLALRRKR